MEVPADCTIMRMAPQTRRTIKFKRKGRKRKRQSTTERLDVRFLQRPELDEAHRVLLSATGGELLALGRCEVPMGNRHRISHATSALDVDPDVRAACHGAGHDTAGMREAERQCGATCLASHNRRFSKGVALEAPVARRDLRRIAG